MSEKLEEKAILYFYNKYNSSAMFNQFLLYPQLHSITPSIIFATFFSNSTAHYQHYFWRNMDPPVFDHPPSATDHSSLEDAIAYGYRSMDKLLGRFLTDYGDSTLILCTALSQQPWKESTKVTFRPRDFDRLMEVLGFKNVEVKPVMAEQFHIEFRDESLAALAATRLKELVMGEEQLMAVRQEGTSVFTGCRITSPDAASGEIQERTNGLRIPFDELFYMIHSMRSGHHHPHGALWIRTGKHQVAESTVPLTDIAPTILSRFGVEQPGYMEGKPLPV